MRDLCLVRRSAGVGPQMPEYYVEIVAGAIGELYL